MCQLCRCDSSGGRNATNGHGDFDEGVKMRTHAAHCKWKMQSATERLSWAEESSGGMRGM